MVWTKTSNPLLSVVIHAVLVAYSFTLSNKLLIFILFRKGYNRSGKRSSLGRVVQVDVPQEQSIFYIEELSSPLYWKSGSKPWVTDLNVQPIDDSLNIPKQRVL